MSGLKWILGGSVCCAIGALWGWFSPVTDRVTFLDVGQGDCAVIQAEGTTVLVDAGPKDSYTDAGERIVVPKLLKMGVSGIDMILLSHPDMDHIGGTGAVLKRFPGAKLAISDTFRFHHQLLEQLTLWGLRPDQVQWLGSEYVGRLGTFQLRIECPRMGSSNETNDGSMLVRVSRDQGSVLLTGDATVKVEEEVEPLADWHSEILKVGHHGSHTSTSQGWVEAVRPQFAIISCGKGNRYGHPHKEVVDRLKTNGVKILRTDQEGDIQFDFLDGRFVRD